MSDSINAQDWIVQATPETHKVNLTRLKNILHRLQDHSDAASTTAYEIAVTLAARLILVDNPLHISAVAKELGSLLKESRKLPEIIRRVQDKSGWHVIKVGKTNARSSVIDDASATASLRNLESLFASLAQFVGEPVRPLVRIGCGRALASYFVPHVLKKYRENTAGDAFEFDVEITDAEPDAVAKMLEREEIDFAITSFDDACSFGRVIVEVGLPIKLLFDRRNERVAELAPQQETLSSQEWQKLLYEMRVALQDHRSRPQGYTVPTTIFPSSAETVQVESWGAAMAMTLSGGNVCCTAAPQIIDPRIRCQFREFNLPIARIMKFQVRSAERKGPAIAPNRILKSIEETLKAEVNVMGRDLRPPNVLYGKQIYTAHTTTDPSGRRCWMRGLISHVAITPDGYFQANHCLIKHWTGDWGNDDLCEKMEFTLDGYVLQESDRVHLVWAGREIGGNRPETYATELVHDTTISTAAVTSHAIGVWSGRSVWQMGATAGIPSAGWFVTLQPGKERLSQHELAGLLAIDIRKSINDRRVFDPAVILSLPSE